MTCNKENDLNGQENRLIFLLNNSFNQSPNFFYMLQKDEIKMDGEDVLELPLPLCFPREQ